MTETADLFARYTLHHVGVVSPGLEEAETLMANLGLVEDYRGYVEQWSCWCIFTKAASGAAIELVVAEGGPLARFNKGAGGVHHFAFEVEDIRAASAWAEGRGLKMLEPEPIKGAGDFWCNFIHPVATRGVQIEFVEPFR
jgi:methylmalonyl-CoA/ethylmalonyl-CoA epimerase